MSPVQKPIESLPTLSTKDVPRKEAQQGLAEPQVSSTKPPSCTKEKLKLTRAALSKCARRTGSVTHCYMTQLVQKVRESIQKLV